MNDKVEKLVDAHSRIIKEAAERYLKALSECKTDEDVERLAVPENRKYWETLRGFARSVLDEAIEAIDDVQTFADTDVYEKAKEAVRALRS